MPNDNIKSHKKTGFHPLFRRNIFRKTTGWGVSIWPPPNHFRVKVSEYPFKQNKNMLKNMTVLLYIYFYISLNVLRPTFFNICKLSFLRSPNIGKIRVKVGPKNNYFFYILSSFTNRIAVFRVFLNFFFNWYVANEERNKTVAAIFFFPNIFWIIYF